MLSTSSLFCAGMPEATTTSLETSDSAGEGIGPGMAVDGVAPRLGLANFNALGSILKLVPAIKGGIGDLAIPRIALIVSFEPLGPLSLPTLCLCNSLPSVPLHEILKAYVPYLVAFTAWVEPHPFYRFNIQDLGGCVSISLTTPSVD